MLEQPRSENIGCYFWEDSPLLGVLLAGWVVVVAAVRAVAAADAGVAGITCNNTEKQRNMKTNLVNARDAQLKRTTLSEGSLPIWGRAGGVGMSLIVQLLINYYRVDRGSPLASRKEEESQTSLPSNQHIPSNRRENLARRGRRAKS